MPKKHGLQIGIEAIDRDPIQVMIVLLFIGVVGAGSMYLGYNWLKQSNIAKVPQEQVRTSPVPQPTPVPQKPQQQSQESQESKVANANLLLIISIAKVVAFVLFVISAFVMLHLIAQGEDIMSVATPTIVMLMFTIMLNMMPSLLGSDIATVKSSSPTATNDLLNPDGVTVRIKAK